MARGKAPQLLLYPKRPGRGGLRWVFIAVGMAAATGAIVVGVASISSGGRNAPDVTDGGGVPAGTNTPTLPPNHMPAPTPKPITVQLAVYVNGQGTISPSGGVFNQGDVVRVSANPGAGLRFDHWSGNASGSSPTVTVTMHSNRAITAHFVPLNPPIIVTVQRIETSTDSKTWVMERGGFYFHMVVSDGKTTQETRFPSSEVYSLGNYEGVNTDRVSFHSGEVGDYLTMVFIGYEGG